MKFPKISVAVGMFCMASFAVAVLVGRASQPGPNEGPATASSLNIGPQSVVIETGSVEHRLRAMESQLLELRNKVASLEEAKKVAP
jgi:hypothetical protein